MGALDNYSLVFVIFIIFFGQLKDWVGQVHFLVSCPKGQVEKYVNVEACSSSDENYEMFLFIYLVGYVSPPGSSFLPIGNRLSPAGSNPSPGARSAGHLVRSSLSPTSSSLSSHLEPVGYGLGTCKYLALINYSDLKLVLIIV
jgi:hypothetical protein